MKKACLFLLAGLYAPQLSSFASHSDLFLLFAFAIVAGIMAGRLPAVMMIAAGYVAFVVAADEVVETRISADYVGDSLMVEVRVADFPQMRDRTLSFIGEVRDNPWVPARVRISWFEPAEEIAIGDVWRLELRLRRPRGNSNPGVFDYETWLFRNRIAATGYVVDSTRNEFLRTGDADAADAIRLRIVQRIRETVERSDRAAVLAAVSVGARHLVTRDQWDRYAMTGTTHLMAISGLHIGMVAAAGYFASAIFAGLLRLKSNHHILSMLVALAFACAYAGLSGLAVPAKRSVLMIGLSAMAIGRSRLLRPFTVVAAACLVLSMLAPLATLEPGFKLSFTAVLILIWISRRSKSGTGRVVRPAQAVGLLATMQIALLLGLLPLTVLLFGRVALAAPIVNLVAVPIFSLATVPLTLCGLLFDGLLEPVGNQSLRLASASLGLVEWWIDLALLLPAASMPVPQVSAWPLVTLFTALAWVVLPPGWPGRGIAWIALLSIILYEPARPSPGCAQLDVLDVGQGLAVVVTTQSRTLLFDTGPAFRSGGSAAESVVLPFLAGRGSGRIDDLVVSHADLDHAGGVADIGYALQVNRLIAGESTEQSMPGVPCHRGMRWEADGVGFEFIYPPRSSPLEGNDASCVLQVVAGEHRALLSGDIEGPAEDELLRAGLLRRSDIVIVPHHGSRTSSGAAFVSALSPKLAIISAGFGNRWGLPDEEVVARWQDAGAEVLNTAHDGAISLRMCGRGGITSLSSQRERQHRFWHE
jgi:competence protein ComEC